MKATAWSGMVVLLAGAAWPAFQPGTAQLTLVIGDEKGQMLPCRIHLYDPQGKPVQAPNLPFWRDHFACSGRVSLPLPPGNYRYEIERGPEYRRVSRMENLVEGRSTEIKITLDRLADLAAAGWYSGDLHVHRPLEDIEWLMQAEDVHVAPVITWWNARNLWAKRDPPREHVRRFDGNRFYDVMAGEDERGGGALLFFHLDAPLLIGKAAREFPSPLTFVAAARKRNKDVWIDVEKPFWWDVPCWLASGQADSIGLANNHMCRSQMYQSEAWGKPRDERQFPPPTGNGRWSQEIYYHILNCGLRLPPSAGSASGVLPNPVGYNRVYVHLDGPLDYAAWWEGLKAGRSFVTNGPLLLCRANGQRPGHVFRAAGAGPLQITLDVDLTSEDRVPKLEVIKNGKVDQTVDLKEAVNQRASARVTFQESGWFLVRAVADHPGTFRFASTAPFYVETGGQPTRISRRSADFFLQWIGERIERLGQAKLTAEELGQVVRPHEEARKFFRELKERGTDD